jgi:hypothetical protein
MTTGDRLPVDEIPFGLWTEVPDPLTGGTLPGQGVHRFFRFRQPVRLERLEVPAPNLAAGSRHGSPRHVVVYLYAEDLGSARVAFDGQLPPLASGETYTLLLDGARAHAASVLCDERYPIDAPIRYAGGINHPTTYTLPFYMLDNLRGFGSEAAPRAVDIPWQPPLERGRIVPEAAAGQTVTTNKYEVRFSSRYLSVGFALGRPHLSWLGWDALGAIAHENLLYRNYQLTRKLTGGNGPYLYDLHSDLTSLGWTGRVEVEGNRVRYSELRVRPGLTVSAEFEVHERTLSLSLTQTVDRPLTVLDAAAWGFLWNGRAAAIATNALPIRGQRRNGGIEPRGAFAAPGLGGLNFCAVPPSENVALQIDSSGFHGRTSMAGIQLGARHEPTGVVTLLPGEHTAMVKFDVRTVEPAYRPGAASPPDGLRRGWASTFAFRPEGGGFSNNGFSINCQNCLYFQADEAPYTALPADGPDLIEMVRYTASLAAQGGPGYGCYWEQAMDAAPSVGVSLARVHQARPNLDWLRSLWPHLRRPYDYVLAHLDAATGLYVHPHYTGNAGTHLACCNLQDTICFGHFDAYSGALAYRALRGGAALAREAGDDALAARCRDAADGIKAAYVPTLLNPATGLIAGWRSADGEFHDHSYTYVNGMAICYGLVEPALARSILTTLERERAALGHDDFHFGLCLNLKPIPRSDYLIGEWGSPARDAGDDTFGVYINGSLTPTLGYYYLSALSRHGFTAAADRICAHLMESFARRQFDGGPNSGLEYFTFDGTACGYEGSLTHGPHVLLAAAQHLGLISTLEPEWWPA